MNQLNRRSFLKQSALATASLSFFPAIAKSQGSANGDIRVAVVGFAGRGGSHISGFSGLKGARVVALCDVDEDVLAKGVKRFKDKGEDVAGYQDMRKAIESKDVDVLSFATPNHWHALGTIWAVQAGKDVYVEKREEARRAREARGVGHPGGDHPGPPRDAEPRAHAAPFGDPGVPARARRGEGDPPAPARLHGVQRRLRR
jgi:hypothetical protein